MVLIQTTKEIEMSLLNAFDNYLVGFRTWRARSSARRTIANLPLDVQKDIGWPDAYERQREHHLREQASRNHR